MEEEPELWAPLTDFLSYHPSYCQVFKESVDLLLYGQGPLPFHQRHFVALMAAARHDCEFLSEVHSAEFLRSGGEPEWLRLGLTAAPAKLRKLDVLNRILAHQPWAITPAHLAALTKTSSANDNWSLAELMHGAIILSLIHALASFVKGCGIISSQPPSPHQPTAGGDNPADLSNENLPANQSPQVSSASEVDLLMAKMKAMSEAASTSEPLSPEERAQQFQQVISPEGDKSAKALRLSPQTSPVHSRSPNHSPRAAAAPPLGPVPVPPSASAAPSGVLYTEDPALFEYVDFVKRPNSSLFPTFKIHDYSWEDQGYSLVSQLYGELADWMDRKFRLAQALTYQTMGQYSGVDTRPFRIALWNYIQSLFGIRHDDYDYQLVNSLLRRPMKELVKTVCCFPHRCSESLRQGVMTEFQHSERVHVMLLLSEARQQSELLYFLRAVMRFMTS